MVHRDMYLVANQLLQLYLHPGDGEQRRVATLEADIDITPLMVLPSGHATKQAEPGDAIPHHGSRLVCPEYVNYPLYFHQKKSRH